MIRFLQISVLLFPVQLLFAQFQVYFQLRTIPQIQNNDSFYIAGNFNSWNPNNQNSRFLTDEKGVYGFSHKMPAGIYEFKITRGSWDKVECTKNGASTGNRFLKLESDTVIVIDVEGWQDKFSLKARKSTASSNVNIVSASFYIPQLKRTRRIWIYLPEEYNGSKKRYPVLYMHDGQNVFEDTTAYAGEWGVDEFLDSLKTTKCIIVAVDHGGDKRLNEYSPFDMDKFGKGGGRQYVDFMAKTLKKFIDKRYRTLRDRQNTFIAGSSMGGLISLYAILRYPKVFGGSGVFSPAFWVAPGIFDEIRAKGSKVRGKVFFYAGKKESETMVPLMIKAFGEMAAVSNASLQTIVRDDGKHNESTWRKEFPLFYKWIIQ